MSSMMDSQPIYTILGGVDMTDLDYSPNISSSTSSSYLRSPDTTVFFDPWLEIVEQPSEMFRFRYLTESQGTPHGPVMGAHATKSKKTFPAVRLHNFKGEAIIRCWLFTADGSPGPHVHKLVTKVGQKEIKEEPHDILVNEHNNYTASFENLVIIHSVRKECYDPFYEKKLRCNSKFPWVQPMPKDKEAKKKILADIKQEIKKMNMNIVTLFFEALIQCDGTLQRLCEVMSRPIKNKKNAEYGDLKIVRSDREYGSCRGGDEVFIFVEKVTKEVKIKFYEEDASGNIVWSDYATFSQLDIHHLVAIAFRTPPYKDMYIDKNVTVRYHLERPNDTSVSNSMEFVYKLSEYRPPLKRARVPEPIQYPDSTNILNLDEVRIDQISIEDLLYQMPSASDNEFSLPDIIGNLDTDGPLENDVPGSCGGIEKGSICAVNKESKIVREGKKLVETTVNTLRSLSSLSRDESLSALLATTHKNGCNSLHWAVILQMHSEFKFLLDIIESHDLKDAINAKNFVQRTPLHLAVKMGVLDFARSLIDVGADVNTQDKFGHAPVHTAVLEHPKCIPVLLESQNINLNITTREGLNALHLASMCNSLESVQLLLDRRIDLIESINLKNGDSALHISANLSHLDITLELLKNEADVNTQNFAGNTPMHICVVNGDLRTAHLLLKYKADVKICNFIEFEEKSYLKWDKSGDCLKRLRLSEVAKGQSVFHLATSEEMFKLLQSNPGATDGQPDVTAELTLNGNFSLSGEGIMNKLCNILDSDNRWIELANRLGQSSLIPIMEKSPHPSRILLNCLDVSQDEDCSLQNLIAVDDLMIAEAVQLIKENCQ